MSIELITVGNEILSGFTINTNAAYMGQQLLQEGLKVSRETVVPDEKQSLSAGIKEALKRSRLVITTGGLGPTNDDITLQVAAELFDSDFYFDQQIANDLRQRFGDTLSTIDNQATVPRKAKPLINPLGTAPGSLFSDGTTHLLLLPGVPHEMQAMFTTYVIPLLSKLFPKHPPLHYEILHLIRFKEADINAHMQQLQKSYPSVEMGIYPSLGELTVRLFADDQQVLQQIKQELVHHYTPFLYQAPSIAHAVHELLTEKKCTLSTAESCTGGHLAARLTAIPGASAYFLGSVISYANAIKVKTLGVSAEQIAEHGAVSEEVVKQMATGILRQTESDYALAVSGIAGPTGATPQKPVGTLWCALCKQQESTPQAWLLQSGGTREMIITHAVTDLLCALFLEIAS